MSSGASLTSWGEYASLASAGNPSSVGVMIKMSYGVYVIHRPAPHPYFPIRLVITESGFIVRSFETDKMNAGGSRE